jgi:hypothetical protein
LALNPKPILVGTYYFSSHTYTSTISKSFLGVKFLKKEKEKKPSSPFVVQPLELIIATRNYYYLDT